jgi:hypothetical protein
VVDGLVDEVVNALVNGEACGDVGTDVNGVAADAAKGEEDVAAEGCRAAGLSPGGTLTRRRR